jgi:hypothetical protein
LLFADGLRNPASPLIVGANPLFGVSRANLQSSNVAALAGNFLAGLLCGYTILRGSVPRVALPK